MIKRFYMQLYCTQNKRFVYKRHCNVSFKESLNAMQRLVKKHITEDNSRNIAYFLFRFLNVKVKEDRGNKNESGKRGELVNDTCKAFSRPKFKSI
mmetsp:Transcript_20076/g.17775  ORF Transcript_20076/g.17775 Transcript_20076/m.17775 type:complete len:95 (-) Transcript_20076:197-481(-)